MDLTFIIIRVSFSHVRKEVKSSLLHPLVCLFLCETTFIL